MSSTKLKAAILIISDTAARDPSTDKAYHALNDTFTTNGADQWNVVASKIVPDSVLDIQRTVTQWSDGADFVNLVITTGGTGFTSKDNTPEAIHPLIHRHAPGLVHGMLAASLTVTPFAMMSRPVAGVRNKTLILTLPGSPKGAQENLQSVLKLLPHACIQAAGADSRSIHAGGVEQLEKDADVGPRAVSVGTATGGHHHHHQHIHHHRHDHGGHAIPKAHTNADEHPRSNDPGEGPTRRYRASPYPMLSVEDATRVILEHTPAPETCLAKVDTSLQGSVLAEDVEATEAVPAYRASIVDGYAVIVSPDGPSTKGVFPVASVSHASPGEIAPLKPGQIARITTGAPLPPGATSVVMVEDTVLKSMTEDGKEEQEVEILTDKIKPNENVREIGSDIRKGEVILRKGDQITAVGGELGLLASVGKAEVTVYKKPIVGVLSTGDEIVPHDRPGELRLGEVRDCNRPTVMAAISGWGFEVVDLGIAKDKPGDLETTLRSALLRVTVLITTGGVSMGELDLLKPTIERSLGGTIHFGRVAMKPGKPTTFATVPFKPSTSTSTSSARLPRLLFALPGNPASALVTLHLFVLPSLHRTAGVEPPGLPRVRVKLEHEVRCDAARAEFHRAVVVVGRDGGLSAASTGGQRSSRVGSLKAANALLCLPAGGEVLREGEMVEALLMGRVGGVV